jgi:hypothetical protein
MSDMLPERSKKGAAYDEAPSSKGTEVHAGEMLK